MAIEIDAVYENGVLKPEKPLPVQEGRKVRVTICTSSNWVDEHYGLIGWTGSVEEAERFATDPELDYPPPPEEP